MVQSKKIYPYGTWPSPISARLMGSRIKIEDVRWTDDGQALVWLESRSDQNMLVKQTPGGLPIDLLKDHSARGGILYGGAEFGLQGDRIYYINKGCQLFRRKFTDENPKPLSESNFRLAAPTPSPDGLWLALVASDGVDDWIAVVDPESRLPPNKLISGADFYMQPVWSPDGKTLAWVEWDHPNMPWDATRLMLARLDGLPPRIIEQKQIAGGDGENYTQPLFSPDGRWLSYIASSGNWEQVMLHDLSSGVTRVLLGGEQMLFSTPAWVQGLHTIVWNCTSERLFAIQNYAGRASLWSVEVETGKATRMETEPFTWLKQISSSPVRDELALIASSTQIPEQLVHWDGQAWKVIREAAPQFSPPELFSNPIELSWLSSDGVRLHGYYYPPASPQFKAEGLPPTIVNIHGGPTHQVALYFPREAPFFTTRGYAWFEVDYRGNIGLGRDYQHALNGRYGELDVEDIYSGVEEVVRRGLADPEKLVLFGGSSGGFTLLNLLAKYPGRFKAGICLYPVTDLETLQTVTDKFEAHYLEQLIGPLPESAKIFKDRSPLYHADQIQDPIAIFHGSDDIAVPLAQAEAITSSLRSRGVPVLLQIYEGEGHGFRKSENVEDCYNRIDQFLRERVISASKK